MKRIISCVLVCLMFIVLFKPIVFADEIKSGDFSYFGLPNSRWSLDSQGTLIFSGTKVPSYKYVSQPPWMPYANEIKKVIISEGIRELENISLNVAGMRRRYIYRVPWKIWHTVTYFIIAKV